MRRRLFILLAGIGLLIRVILAPLAGHPFDTYVYYDVGQLMISGRSFYGVTQYAYPPLWAGVLYPITVAHGFLAPLFGAHPLAGSEAAAIVGAPVGTVLVVDWVFLLLEKIPLIISDTLLAALLYRVVGRRFDRPDAAQSAFLLFYLNPFVVWISSIWGTFDVIPTYLALLGTLFFIDKRGYSSGIMFGLAIAFKYYPVLLLLSLILGLRKSHDRRFVWDVLIGTGFFLGAVSVPFLLIDPVAYVKGILSPAGGVFLGNLSIWVLLPALGVTDIPVWLASLNILLIVAGIGFFSWFLGGKLTASSLAGFWVDMGVLTLLIFYAVFRIINDQYIFWIIPFMTIRVALGRERLWGLVSVSSLVLLAGLVNVAHYSFFLPILTVSPSLLWLVPRMWNVPDLRAALSIVFWFLVVYLLWQLIRRIAGKGEVLQFAKSFVKSLTVQARAFLGRSQTPVQSRTRMDLATGTRAGPVALRRCHEVRERREIDRHWDLVDMR